MPGGRIAGELSPIRIRHFNPRRPNEDVFQLIDGVELRNAFLAPASLWLMHVRKKDP
jgi:hypothetical protein